MSKIKQVRDEVIKLAEAHPDAKYQAPPDSDACSNVNGVVYDGQQFIGTGCIVGQAVKAMGYDPGGDLAVESAESLLAALFGEGDSISFDRSEEADIQFITSVQIKQDGGATWGRALADAIEIERDGAPQWGEE